MSLPSLTALKYYAAPGPLTRLERYAPFLDWLTADVRAIVQVVQGLLIHDMWVERCGARLDWSHSYDTQTAYMEDLLDKALKLDPRAVAAPHSLALPRSPEQRVVCCCREFATLTCAILRHKGIPARSRCGFATYFGEGWHEDHWICEYWNEREVRWVQVDPQIDPFQQSALGMAFSPLNLPDGAFVVAGEAWQKIRSGEIAPERFGISCDPKAFGLESLSGQWFARGQLLRDFAALNKVETVPFLVRVGKGLSWQPWRLVGAADVEHGEADTALLDQIAALSASPDGRHEELRALYEAEEALRPPDAILAR